MKSFAVSFLLFIIIFSAVAQNVRRISFRTMAKDSINLSLNDEYYLIEDSCAQIIRQGHFDLQNRLFFGKFRDVSKADPKVIVSEGSYDREGRKEGAFVVHYINGHLRAKGIFKANNYDGPWEMFYNDGKPELTFNCTNADCAIENAWKPDGTKIIDNGNGVYIADLGDSYWKGKLVNGKPDGTWKLIKTDDISNSALITEYFKKGVFRNGESAYNKYNDASRIKLVDPGKLPLLHAEKMLASPVACNQTKAKHMVNAQYANGLEGFTYQIESAVSSYIYKAGLKYLDNSFSIEGEISEKGALTNMISHEPFREDLARGVILRLKTLPLLSPATADGKPIKQKFIITFIFTDNLYKFTYRFLPLQQQ